MKHKPRQAIHMEKSQLTNWVGPYVGWHGVSGDLQGRANCVSQVDGVSDVVSPISSVALWGGESEKGKWPLPSFCLGKLSPSFCLDATHFSSSLYATDAFQAATSVLELRGNESE